MFSVKQKIFIAKRFNQGLRLARHLVGRDMRVQCRRRGLNWALDLDEGIDLSIYLLGAYEPKTLRAYAPLVKPGAVIFDIGANIGAHTLHFARLVGGTGRVHAFEPTDFAGAKLRTNLALNPAIAPRVALNQLFLVAGRDHTMPAEICSSWPVDSAKGHFNRWHLGKGKSLAGASAMTADEYAAQASLTRLDLVKIDVDGHEYSVLQGCRQILERFHPIILIEFAPFLHDDNGDGTFDDFVRFLDELNYDFFDESSGRALPSRGPDLRALIRTGASINALLHHRSR